MKVVNDGLIVRGRVSCNENVVYINQDKGNDVCDLNEKGRVGWGRLEAHREKTCKQLIIPSSWGLFEPIERLVELANKVGIGLINETLRLGHVDMFVKCATKECIETSNWVTGQSNWTAMERMSRIVGGLAMGLKVSKKSSPSCWWKPLAINWALNQSRAQSEVYLIR